MIVHEATIGSRTALPLRMRPDLVVRPLRRGARNAWTIQDPVTLRYFELRDEEYHILRLLDGRRSLQAVQSDFERRFAPMQLEAAQLHGFLGLLHDDGLIVADAPGQGEQLLTRRRKQRRRKWVGALGNVLAIRLPGIDAEPVLNWLYPKCRWMFSRTFLAACVVLVAAAATLVAVQFDTLLTRLPEFHAFFHTRNVLWIALAVAVAKILHELGHALTCKHFGGEVHELGVMLLVFTPCLYCNVSAAWMLPSKWRRAAVGAAGIGVELVLASVATLLWWFSQPELLNAICLNIMFVCSVSTLLFNGNPLLRFDGYWVLSDVVDVPNMRQQAATIVHRALGRLFLGTELGNARMLPERHRALLAAYYLASIGYRWFIVAAILWFLHSVMKPYGLQSLVYVLGAVVVIGMVAPPLWRAGRAVRGARRNRELKPVRFIVLASATLLLLATVLLYPFPSRVTAPLIIEPRDATRVYVPVGGTLLEAAAIGDPIVAGDTLARLQNLELEDELADLAGQVAEQELRLDQLERLRVSDPTAGDQLPVARQTLADLQQRHQRKDDDHRRLVIVAPQSGTILPPRETVAGTPDKELPPWTGTPLDRENRGCFLEAGTILCLVGDPASMQAMLVIDQADIDLVAEGQYVRIQLDQVPGKFLEGTIEEISAVDAESLSPELAARGLLPTVRDPSGAAGEDRPLGASFEARVTLAPHDATLLSRATGRAKIRVEPQSLARRLYRYLGRTFRFDL